MRSESESPPTLDYAAPRAPAPSGPQVWRIFLCATLFAASHLIAEYQIQTAYHLHNSPPPGTWVYQKVLDHLEEDMMIETIQVSIAAIFVLAFQCFFYRQSLRPRRMDWAIAIALGIAFCAWRWASWWLFSKSKPNGLGLAEVVLLGAISGVILAKWRHTNHPRAITLDSELQRQR